METQAADASIVYRPYVGESDLPSIMALVQSELSEPYVIYTYRYFLRQWPHLSFLAYSSTLPTGDPIGVIVCKQSLHRDAANRGYIAMLSVDRGWRKRGIARTLVRHSVDAMKEHGVEEVVLETEFDNAAALSLYESLGFIREKRLHRFYMNGKDAFRLILAVPPPPPPPLLSSGSGSASSSYSDSEDAVNLIRSAAQRRTNVYNTRVLPEFIAGFDDSDDEVSMR
ncbi:acyl-CoA N-acyltransferase [Fomitiporia mediterranea MF3/22]|uniref:acyl-CoA N-acyltransferase n=1 Tax=Fomitiporia mediterranea (strain MF3/22) TaxID=694068 RepID=UPI0004409C1B|nr:acyl-CoA N-acyltransferase [Fomitiporia mediterranea MF3/22]EJD04725.1 acyl-CoA N-acyltransferase [Fomitiporia mediterranea MF3/22]